MSAPASPGGAPRRRAVLPTGITTVLFDLDDTLVPYLTCWSTALDAVSQNLAAAHPGATGPGIAAAYTRISNVLWHDYERSSPTSARCARSAPTSGTAPCTHAASGWARANSSPS